MPAVDAELRTLLIQVELMTLSDLDYLGMTHTGHGWRVKEAGGYLIEVMPMLSSWRLHTIPKNGGPWAWSERYWCYQGTGLLSFTRAVLAAAAWDGADDTEPPGWNRNGQTGEWRGL